MRFDLNFEDDYMPATVKAYTLALRHFDDYLSEHNEEIKDESSVFLRYIDHVYANNSRATGHLRVAALRHLCDHLVKQGVLSCNYARKDFTIVATRAKPLPTVTVEQWREWLKASSHNPRTSALLALAGLGLRTNEITGIKMSDVLDGVIKVGRRMVDMSEAWPYIEAYLRHRQAGNEYLFFSYRGTRLTRMSVWREIKNATCGEATPRELRLLRRHTLKSMGVVGQL